MVRGTVESWNDDEGCGVLVSPDAPGGVCAHFSHIEAEGYRTLATGADVSFDYECVPGGQDAYDPPRHANR
jgi:CspA family cold shock protein